MRPWSRYADLKAALEQLGYRLEEQVLDASDFGVPQSRRRLFLMGDRERTPSLTVPACVAGRATVESILDEGLVCGVHRLSLARAERRQQLLRRSGAFAAVKDGTSFLIVYLRQTTEAADGSGLIVRCGTITTVDRFALVEHDGENVEECGCCRFPNFGVQWDTAMTSGCR